MKERFVVLPLLLFAFIAVPIAELAVILTVGAHIGMWPTLALLLGFSVLGAWLAKREGWAAWRRFQLAVAEGRVPTAEVADGALVLLAGALLLTPGFLTDLAGLLLLVPPVRAVVRRRAPAVAGWLLAGRGRGRRRATVVDGSSSTKVTWGTPEADRASPRPLPPADSGGEPGRARGR